MKRLTVRTTVALGLGLGLTLGLLWALDGLPALQAAPLATTRYVATTGTDTSNDCSSSGNPCRTIQHAVDSSVDDDEILVAGGTYSDTFPAEGHWQVVFIKDKTVTVRGGYSTDFATWDPDTYVTTLDGQGAGVVIWMQAQVTTAEITPTLEALHVTNGAIDPGAGGGVYVQGETSRPIHPIISGCHVYSNSASMAGGGIYLTKVSGGELMDNEVYDNGAFGSSEFWHGGGGIAASQVDGVRLMGNRVYSNTAQQSGGGVYVYLSDDVTLAGNEIYGNTTVASAYGGGGVRMSDSDNAVLTSNQIYSNTGHFGGGVYVFSSDGAILTDNRIYGNQATQGGGINSAASESGMFIGNEILGNTATASSGGMHLGSGDGTTLTGNQIHNNTASYDGGGLMINQSDGITLMNNSVTDNRVGSGSSGVGIKVEGASASLLHTTIARNTGGDGSGVFVEDYTWSPTQTLHGVATFTNTILISQTIGISVTSGNTATLTATLWGDGVWANGLDAGGTGLIVSSTNVYSAPGFLDPDNGDYHIGSNSGARDAGIATSVADDIDGDARPFGAAPDLGADEVVCHVRLNGVYYGTVQDAVEASSSESDVVQVAGTCRSVEQVGSLYQVAYITKTLTIRGGYSSDFSTWDPETYPATLDALGRGQVIYIDGLGVPGYITPTLEALRLTNGSSASNAGGIWGRYAQPVISGCHIYSNTARNGSGGGMLCDHCDNAVLADSEIYSNTASSSIALGGGVFFDYSDNVQLTGNRISGNVAAASSFGGGGGIYLRYSDDADWENNMIVDNQISGGTAYGAGVYLAASADSRLLHTTIANNQGGSGQGVFIASSGATAALTNTILVSHTVGIETASGGAATLDATLWGNTTDWSGSSIVTGTLNWWGDPAFVDPDNGDYHLGVGSAAIDRGLSTSLSTDIDGDPRAVGTAPDLGADEGVPALALEKSGLSWFNPGAQITYTLSIANTGVATATNVTLTDTVPTGATFVDAGGGGAESGGVVSWTIPSLLPGGGLATRVFTVTAGDTITNDDYRATPEGLSGVQGTVAVTTYLNHAPLAAGDATPSTLHTGSVTLNGTASSDPDSHALSYRWEQTGGPGGGMVNNPAAATASFAPPTLTGVYTFTLTVTDAYGLVDTAKMQVTVTNDAPAADAGGAQAVSPDTLVTLDGSGSDDADGDTLAYEWVQAGGPSVTLSSATAISPTFTSPLTAGTTLTFTLTVTDTFNAVDTDETVVTVKYYTYLPLVLKQN